jgi:RNA recognition motif-containing protein
MFAEHVDVKYVSLPKNHESGIIKGFAFVDVGSEEDIPKAVETLNGKDIEGRPLRVSRTLPKNQIRSAKKTSKL